MKNAKYKLVCAGRMKIHRTDDKASFYRLKALRDIPEHNVKAGDLGGYVTKKNNLSQAGPCWIGGEAQVIGNVKVSERAYIGGQAVVRVCEIFMQTYAVSPIIIKGGVRVEDYADVLAIRVHEDQRYATCIFEGSVKIYGNSMLENVLSMHGKAKIYGNARVLESNLISGTSEVYGQAKLGKFSTIEGNSKIFDNAIIGSNAKIIDSVIAGDSHILDNQKVIDGKTNEITIGSSIETLKTLNISPSNFLVLPPPPSWDAMVPQQTPQTPTAKGKVYLRILREVQEKVTTYETDIVKIIKYPVMTDRTDPFTQEMVVALNNAQRWSEDPDGDDFKDAVGILEKAFLAAESNALKVASTALSEEDRKKTQNAKKLLAIASNDASSENEKRLSFEQAFKQLEGVIAVPESAVETFRVKIGLAEIEA
jgi:carbonic anhydrase/acetyltransferase-like protein (isoleucine patch superfamily)